jgi:hypothetical protein
MLRKAHQIHNIFMKDSDIYISHMHNIVSFISSVMHKGQS